MRATRQVKLFDQGRHGKNRKDVGAIFCKIEVLAVRREGPLPRELTGGEGPQGGGIARAGECFVVIKNTYGAGAPGCEAVRIRHRNEAVMIEKLNPSEAKTYLPSGVVVTAKGEPASEISCFGGLMV